MYVRLKIKIKNDRLINETLQFLLILMELQMHLEQSEPEASKICSISATDLVPSINIRVIVIDIFQ